MVKHICRNRDTLVNQSNLCRLRKLFPVFKNVEELTKEEEKLYSSIFAYHDLWYPNVALNSFSPREINTIFKMISEVDRRTVEHISFYDFSRTLMYDYEGKKKREYLQEKNY